MNFRLSALLALFLLGCGGGEAQSCGSAPIVIQLFGDSTMVGWSAAQPQGNPAADLQAYLDRRFGAGRTRVEARAVSGTTATQLVAGTDGLNKPWPQSVAADVLVVNHGINDMQARDLVGYRAALQSLARGPAVVIFETQNATWQWDGSAYAQAMRDVAAANGLKIADTFAFTQDKRQLLSDWAHPTAQLYAMISAATVQPAVGAAVAAMRCQ